jgi:hypothetical protein
MKRILPWIFGAVCACGIDVPSVGVLIDPTGALRAVKGVAGNFLLGAPAALGIISAACSEQLCLAKTDSQILSAIGATDAPPGPAIFGFDAQEAIVYFPETRSFARWREEALNPLDWNVGGEVLSLRVRGGQAEIAVRRAGDVWLIRPDGSVIDWIATTPGPALLLSDGVLFATADALVLRSADQTEIRFALIGAEVITQMGPHYATVRVGNSFYAVRTDPGREQLFLLPAPGDPQ